MRTFNYYTVPTILQNYDNINFNIRLHNEYYLPKIYPDQQPDKLMIFDDRELQSLIKWGIHIMQQHTIELLRDPNYVPIIFSNDVQNEEEIGETTSIKEHCFTMQDLRWNISDKKIYRVQKRQPKPTHPTNNVNRTLQYDDNNNDDDINNNNDDDNNDATYNILEDIPMHKINK